MAVEVDVSFRPIESGDFARTIGAILAIEWASFEHPWSGQDFRRILFPAFARRGRRGGRAPTRSQGFLAIVGEEIVGYVIFDVQGKVVRLLNLAVAAEYRRRGIGGALVAAASWRRVGPGLWAKRGERVRAVVAESNLPAQLFFRARGFRCLRILRRHYDSGGDAYQFESKIPLSPLVRPPRRKEFRSL